MVQKYLDYFQKEVIDVSEYTKLKGNVMSKESVTGNVGIKDFYIGPKGDPGPRGEKGEKGDAGSIKFKIVNELPTENIDESCMYLLPFTEAKKDEDGNLVFNNNFHEYIYVDGAWECIGSASVEVKLDDYVKKDDYATSSTGGTIKVSHGNTIAPLYRDNQGNLHLGNSNESIDMKTGEHAVRNKDLDYAVMKALSDSKLEWTANEKSLVRKLLELDVQSPFGVQIYNGSLRVNCATKTEIDARNNWYRPITPNLLDYAVKKALSDCKLEGDDVWTEEEKTKALEQLGIILCEFGTPIQGRVAVLGLDGQLSVGPPTMYNSATTKKYVDDGFVAKRTVDRTSVYGIDGATNEQVLFDVDSSGSKTYCLVRQKENGRVAVGSPIASNDATPKHYVDNLVGSVESILTELHTYAQTKIGGEA